MMTAGPQTIGRTMLAVEALALMEQRKITSLVVVDADGPGRRRRCTCTTSGARRCSDGKLRARSSPASSRCSSALPPGKAWERHKLQEGRWIDRRRRPGVAALHPRA
ncbi:MAG: hypothetical protein MZU95_03190 [Desulfomicrobium escambiense]|nr:hypothetical protein [Desulfomicrobium escambiense]